MIHIMKAYIYAFSIFILLAIEAKAGPPLNPNRHGSAHRPGPAHSSLLDEESYIYEDHEKPRDKYDDGSDDNDSGHDDYDDDNTDDYDEYDSDHDDNTGEDDKYDSSEYHDDSDHDDNTGDDECSDKIRGCHWESCEHHPIEARKNCMKTCGYCFDDNGNDLKK